MGARRRRRASERRLAKGGKLAPIGFWALVIIVVVALVFSIARIMR